MEELSVLCCFPILAIGGFVLLWSLNSSGAAKRRQRELQEARQNYQAALKALKQAPHDTELRERAVAWGRHYASVTRKHQDKKGRGTVTIYDEMAMWNDINAVAGGAAPVSSATSSVQSSPLSVKERLQNLERLRKENLISEKEYLQRREKILEDI